MTEIRSDLGETLDTSVTAAIKRAQVKLKGYGIEFVDVLMTSMFEADEGDREVRLGFVNEEDPWKPITIENAVLRVRWKPGPGGSQVALILEDRDLGG